MRKCSFAEPLHQLPAADRYAAMAFGGWQMHTTFRAHCGRQKQRHMCLIVTARLVPPEKISEPLRLRRCRVQSNVPSQLSFARELLDLIWRSFGAEVWLHVCRQYCQVVCCGFSASGQITPPKWPHTPAFANPSQTVAINMAIPNGALGSRHAPLCHHRNRQQVIPLRAEQKPQRKITAPQAKPPDGLAI
jgi:hypothetical protein